MLAFELWQILVGAFSAFLIGVSKTGVPGVGILVVPLLATAFGGRASVGTMLPMLIVGDVFAVLWYRQHTQWYRLVELLPWVLVGLGLGALVLWRLGEMDGGKDFLEPLIGALVLAMLAVHLLRLRWGDRLTPHSPLGIATIAPPRGSPPPYPTQPVPS